ncbi:phasin family protein [Rugamonas sp. CCM 8940]|uniref:phasin family protein n=1 Tax=Rugamonas sp. CCM 8940 TaxID=2765359 RepID=UPI0018F61F98|nr:phasin family protein [Rugamonas sp. CCM 8940]MBJ7313709.1 phasin family protein [Rugamonas sp. CCM 8940]
MFSITEQFSAATKSQLEAQLNLLNNFASKAVESAEKVIALNLSTTKATVEKSSSAAQQLLTAKDGQEFFRLSASQTPSLDNLLAYSRQLFSIASDAQAILLQSAGQQIRQTPPVLPSGALTAPAAAPTATAEAKFDAQAAPAPEAKAEVKTEVKAEAQVEAKPEVRVEAAAKAEPKLEDNLDQDNEEDNEEDDYEEAQPKLAAAKPAAPVLSDAKPAAPAVSDAKPAALAKSAAKPAAGKK